MAKSAQSELPHCRCTLMNRSSKAFFCVCNMAATCSCRCLDPTELAGKLSYTSMVLSGQPIFETHTQCRLFKLIIWTKSLVSDRHINFLANTSVSCRPFWVGHCCFSSMLQELMCLSVSQFPSVSCSLSY